MLNFQALLFEKCDGLQISGTNHMNGPAVHISVDDSQDVSISNIHINAPKNSHNTDGIDITRSTRVNIHNNLINNGKYSNYMYFFTYILLQIKYKI